MKLKQLEGLLGGLAQFSKPKVELELELEQYAMDPHIVSPMFYTVHRIADLPSSPRRSSPLKYPPPLPLPTPIPLTTASASASASSSHPSPLLVAASSTTEDTQILGLLPHPPSARRMQPSTDRRRGNGGGPPAPSSRFVWRPRSSGPVPASPAAATVPRPIPASAAPRPDGNAPLLPLPASAASDGRPHHRRPRRPNHNNSGGHRRAPPQERASSAGSDARAPAPARASAPSPAAAVAVGGDGAVPQLVQEIQDKLDLAEARREMEAGNDAYRKAFLETAVSHYTRGARLDPGDISFLTNRAAAYLLMSKYRECVRDCDEAVEKGRELRADNKLVARALSRKASALLKLAGCAGDYEPAIRTLQQSLAEHYSEETRAKLDEAESARKEIEERERLGQEAADYHREIGNGFFKKKKYQEAAVYYTEAMKKNPNDPRIFSNRAQCHIYLGALPEGLDDADKCIELDPTFLKGYVHKAKIQFLMGNYESALATYLEGLKCDPNNLVVIDGLRRCAACIKRSNGGDVRPEDWKEILGDFRSDNDLLNKLQRSMEELAVFKKEASDERLRRIESERMARTSEDLYLNQVQQRKETEEYLSKIQQELQQLKIRQDEVIEELQKANEHNESLQNQLSESREHYNCLLSEHDHLLHERDRAVREVEELRQKRGQMLSVLLTAMHCEFSSSELEFATENFSSSLKIGEGGFGCVYRGVLRDTTVAIKVLRPDSLQGQSEFEQVAVLSRVRHPHLVTLLGACSELSTLVYEFLPNGSLEDFLACADKRQSLTWQIRVRIIAEICSALIFLHKNKPHPVVHGDLKPANILLDVNLVSKLSDFGISRMLIQCSTNNTTLYRTMHPAGTPMYMDPEFLATGEMTPRSDVYSFGIVILRLLTGKPPVGIKKIVEDAMEQGDLNSIIDTSAGEWPDVQVQQLAYLALRCTELSRRCRPDLSGELWRAVVVMRDAATLNSPSSSRSVLDENRTPSYFICPISQDVMNDPHFAADGFTYEAEAIRGWLGTGHDTSPMTNLPLEHDELIPNLALRSAIQEWLQQQNMVPSSG